MGCEATGYKMKEQILEVLFSIIVLLPLVGLFHLLIWIQRGYYFVMKEYYDFRGIKYHVQHDKFTKIITRIKEKR